MPEINEQEMTFQEFEEACRQEGRPLYAGFYGKTRANTIEYFYHVLTLKVVPKNLYPQDTMEGYDYSNVAHLPKKTWHGFYADALMELYEKGK